MAPEKVAVGNYSSLSTFFALSARLADAPNVRVMRSCNCSPAIQSPVLSFKALASFR